MLRRCFVLSTVVALMCWAAPARADNEEDVKPGTHEGKVVKIDGTKLTMSDKDGNNKHTHAVPADAKILIDGKESKLTDLKAGMEIKVTAEKQGDKNQITKIEGKKA
jgi:hypothetical protein